MKQVIKNIENKNEAYDYNKMEQEPVDSSSFNRAEEKEQKSERPIKSLVRLHKTILFDEMVANRIDSSIVNPKFYNSFNYSLLPGEHPRGKMTIGITSPRVGDGKTLVACNLAASISLTTENEVMLVDLNFQRPKVHDVFNAELSPGFLESITMTSIRAVQTKINNLSVLTSGDYSANALQSIRYSARNGKEKAETSTPAIGLEQLVEFRNIIFTLQENFDIVVADLPSIDESVLPTLFMKQLDGVIVVVNAGRTKMEDIDRLMSQFTENQLLGFVFNRAPVGHTA